MQTPQVRSHADIKTLLANLLSSIFTHPVQLKHAQQFPNPTPAKAQSERIGENNKSTEAPCSPAGSSEQSFCRPAHQPCNSNETFCQCGQVLRSKMFQFTWSNLTLYNSNTNVSVHNFVHHIFCAFKFAVKLHRKRAMTFLVRLLIQASDQSRIQLLRVIASHDQQTAGCVYYTIQRVEDTSQVQGIPAISRRVTMGTNRAPNSSTWCQIATRPKDSNGLSDFPECSRVSKHDHSFPWWRES